MYSGSSSNSSSTEDKKDSKENISDLPIDMFLNTLDLLNIQDTSTVNRTSHAFQTKTSSELSKKEKILKKLIIDELDNLKTSGPHAGFYSGLIEKIIKNIEKYGIFNRVNNALLEANIFQSRSHYPLQYLYQDAILKSSILIPFIMRSLDTSFDDIRTFLEIDIQSTSTEIFNHERKNEWFSSIYHFLGKYKNYTHRIGTRSYLSDLHNKQMHLLDTAFLALKSIFEESLEIKHSDEYIKHCIRIYTVLMHQQHYMEQNPFKICNNNAWEKCNLEEIFQKISHGGNTALNLKKAKILCQIRAGLLASLLTHHYLEQHYKKFAYEVQLIVKLLISISEDEEDATYFKKLRNQIVELAKKDEILLDLLIEWDTKNYAMCFNFEGLKEEKESKEDKEPSQLLQKLNLTEGMNQDIAEIHSYFMQSQSAERFLLGCSLLEIYKDINTIAKVIDELHYPLNSLENLKSKIQSAIQLLANNKDFNTDEVIQVWNKKLFLMHSNIIHMIGHVNQHRFFPHSIDTTNEGNNNKTTHRNNNKR